MRIYLDHNATTPLREEVADEMARTLREVWGNPSSTHAEGASAKATVALARERVAACLGASPGQVLFTGGATESNNTVLHGLAARRDDGPRGLVTSAVAHPSVVAPAEWLEAQGVTVTRLPVDEAGLLEPNAVLEAAEGQALVSLIWANNETGVLLPIQPIAEALVGGGAALHVDATQAIGKWPVDVSRMPVDFLSCSAHKFGGPKGVGCLVVAEGREIEPLLRGGPQERRLRGGTENLAGIAAMGVACELARRELSERIDRYTKLRDRLWEGIRKGVPSVRRNGSEQHVLPNTLNVEFEGTAGEVLLQALDLEGIAVSAGAACHSGSISPSHVLTAMGRSPEQARGSLRFSVGHGNDEAQIDRVCEVLAELVPRVRKAQSA
jgi:cysteine desulfurase